MAQINMQQLEAGAGMSLQDDTKLITHLAASRANTLGKRRHASKSRNRATRKKRTRPRSLAA